MYWCSYLRPLLPLLLAGVFLPLPVPKSVNAASVAVGPSDAVSQSTTMIPTGTAVGVNATGPSRSATTGVTLPVSGGGFAACNNKVGVGAPFCLPKHGSLLHPGTTYYITWDPAFFNSSNTTVVVLGNYVDQATNVATDQAFASLPLDSGWAFYAWPVDQALMRGAASVNISISIAALAPGAARMAHVVGPIVTVAPVTRPVHHKPARPRPGKPELLIALPLVFTFVVVMVVGTCLWNRKARRIGLGNVMTRARSRSGFKGGKRRIGRVRSRRRLDDAGASIEESVRLMDWDEVGGDNQRGREDNWR